MIGEWRFVDRFELGRYVESRNAEAKMFPNGSVRCCQESVPCWQAIVACSCRTASRFMNGRLWMNSHKHGTASGCGKNCWMRFMEQAPFGCFGVRFDAWA
jgi:hypothetical protein